MRQMIRERVLSEFFLNGLMRDHTCRRVPTIKSTASATSGGKMNQIVLRDLA